MARKKFQLTGPAVTRGGNTVRQLAGLSHVYLDADSVKADGTPTLDSDREAYVYTDETTRYGYYVLGSSISKIEEKPTLAVGDVVKLARNDHSRFSSEKVGSVGVIDSTRSGSDYDFTIHKLDGGWLQYGKAEDLDLVLSAADVAKLKGAPAPVTPAPRTALDFELAITKAASFFDRYAGTGRSTKLINLAKLLVEVSK